MNRWDELNDPSYVKDGDTQENSSLYSFGVPVTVGVVVMRVRGGTMVSKTRTVHARGNLKAQITDESVLYLKDNKKETNAWFQACGINVPLGGTQLGVIRSIDFNGSIAQNAENVNSGNKSVRWSLNNLSKDAAIHYNDKNRASDFVKDLGLQLPAIFKDIQDSDVIVRDIGVNVNKEIENVTQSQQFKRWFGDWQNDPENASKVVNADGKDGSNPDIRYSLVGETNDGIEVYETSEEVRALPFSERKKLFTEIMREQYAGRTAKFTRNGHVYYARFDESDISKNVYGDKRSSFRGYRAKINVGADGNIFELVENATYNGSRAEVGKDSAAHENVQYWDYFVKTVRIDGRYYDITANVRKTDAEEFVYSIQLNESKIKRASPPIGFHEESVRSGEQRSTDSIAQNGADVNSENEDCGIR